ncbi:hypothetical protein [Ensifer soli]|uniref:hypothetical protein n=1 Tax=Ciceribacter sp. sgz301302 TaxID=3342379 RepID=UPI0035BAD39A
MVGRETYGPNWKDEWIDIVEAPERKLALRYLRAALQSGNVAAHWSTMDLKSSGNLTPQDADRESFAIELKNDCIFHHNLNQPVYCRIHAEQLLAFMRKQEIRNVPSSQLATDRCQEWLVGLFNDRAYQPPKFADLLRQSKESFPNLTDSGFKEARSRAIAITGRFDIGKPGRRKKSNQSAN